MSELEWTVDFFHWSATPNKKKNLNSPLGRGVEEYYVSTQNIKRFCVRSSNRIFMLCFVCLLCLRRSFLQRVGRLRRDCEVDVR